MSKDQDIGVVPDRIEKKTLLRAPRARVWRALTEAREFGTWFRAELDGTFAAGRTVRGRVTYPGYEHIRFEMTVETMEPERRFSYRWHPASMEPDFDYSKEPTTLVEFFLDEVAGGTQLTVIESGFGRLPVGRRDEAFRQNTEGWELQLENIQEHVEK